MALPDTNGARSGTTADAESAARRIRRVRRRLLTWGRKHFADYAWRSESDPWLTLVAELLVQRTRAAQADGVFREVRQKYPTAAALVNAGPDAAREITSRTGLHWRGPLLFETARIVAARGGTPPIDLTELMQLPGVGPYAGAAWLSLHQGKRAVIIDNNVARWLARLEGRPYDAETRRKRWVRDVAGQLTPTRSFQAYNYAVLDFTMQICVPGRPRCADCPIRRDCHFGTPSLRLGTL